MTQRMIRARVELGGYYTLTDGGKIKDYLDTFKRIKQEVPKEYWDSIEIEIFGDNDGWGGSDYRTAKVTYLRPMTPEELKLQEGIERRQKAQQEAQELAQLEALQQKYGKK